MSKPYSEWSEERKAKHRAKVKAYQRKMRTEGKQRPDRLAKSGWYAVLSEEDKEKWRAAARRYYHRTRGESQLKSKHGITVAERDAMMEVQGGLCAICRKPPNHDRRADRTIKVRVHALKVDHDHVTGVIRGLLCDSCNTGLGHFRDDVNLLQTAMNYLVNARPGRPSHLRVA